MNSLETSCDKCNKKAITYPLKCFPHKRSGHIPERIYLCKECKDDLPKTRLLRHIEILDIWSKTRNKPKKSEVSMYYSQGKKH